MCVREIIGRYFISQVCELGMDKNEMGIVVVS